LDRDRISGSLLETFFLEMEIVLRAMDHGFGSSDQLFLLFDNLLYFHFRSSEHLGPYLYFLPVMLLYHIDLAWRW
jgi:hypothetical protein